MTARDVTGFYASFSARKSGNFLQILGPFPEHGVNVRHVANRGNVQAF